MIRYSRALVISGQGNLAIAAAAARTGPVLLSPAAARNTCVTIQGVARAGKDKSVAAPLLAGLSSKVLVAS